MPYSSLLYIIPILLCLSYLTWLTYILTLYRLSPYPGALFADISRLWYVLQNYDGSSDHTMRRLHSTHGPIIRIAPDEVSIVDPAAISIIYDARGTSPKTDIYDIRDGKTGKRNHPFSERDEVVHAPRRRIVNSVYSMPPCWRAGSTSTPLPGSPSADWTTSLPQAPRSTSASGLERYTADVVGELMFGKRLGALGQGVTSRVGMRCYS
jgi:hypothetical protein